MSVLCLIAELHNIAVLINILLEIVGAGMGFDPVPGSGSGSVSGAGTALGGKIKNLAKLRID